MTRYNYIKYLILAFAIFGLGISTSCDDAKNDELGVHAFIKNALTGSGTNLIVLSDESTITNVEIHLSDLSATDNNYTLVADQSVLDQYNTKNGTNYLMLPDDFYTIPDEIRIKAGAYNSETVKIEIKAFSDEMISSGESYALPLKLKEKKGSIMAMNTTGTYVIATSPILKFSAPMFTNAANLHADKFDDSPETYGEYTIEVRFQVSNTGNRDRAIYKSGVNDDNNFILLRFEDPQSNTADHKRHSLVQVVGRNRVYLNPLYSFEPDKWQHLALTCDGSNYRLYVNGKYSGVKEIPAGPTKFFGVNWFTGGDSGGDPWRGCKILMSEARIWSVCRTELQIQNNMTITSPKAPGLEAYWRFNEGEGNVFQDATGNGHTLRTSAQPLWIHEILSSDEKTSW